MPSSSDAPSLLFKLSLNDADYIPQTLIKVVEDGIITEEEKPEIEKILASLQKISEAATETRIWIEKHM